MKTEAVNDNVALTTDGYGPLQQYLLEQATAKTEEFLERNKDGGAERPADPSVTVGLVTGVTSINFPPSPEKENEVMWPWDYRKNPALEFDGWDCKQK